MDENHCTKYTTTLRIWYDDLYEHNEGQRRRPMMTLAQALFLALLVVGTLGMVLFALWYDKKHNLD